MVGTPIEALATRVRWNLKALHRYRFPEMREASLEERRLPAVLQKLLPGNDANCVDVGAHIGGFLSLLRKLFPNGKHVAIEASPTKAGWVRKTFPLVKIHGVAVAEKDGRATFEDNAARPGYSRLLNGGQKHEGSQYYDVEVTTLDSLLADAARIDFIKIDIEGGELNALRGCVNVLKTHRPIVLFEVGSEYDLEKMKVSRKDLHDFLTGVGYDVYTFTDILFDKEPMEFSEFKKCGLWPFRAFNFIAKPRAESLG